MIIYQSEGMSDCCGAPVYVDVGICSDCKEHCEIQRPCPDCEGKGEIDELDKSKVTGQTISPPYHKVKCNACDGEGFIIEEL